MSFHSEILGRCHYRHFYLTNELYGGYSYQCERGFGSADYVNPNLVLELAEKAGFATVHLAGGVWELVGRKGWGEEVTVGEARRLVEELRKRRG